MTDKNAIKTTRHGTPIKLDLTLNNPNDKTISSSRIVRIDEALINQ